MPITREFLNWQQPALPQVVAYLQQRYGAGSQDLLDLKQVIVVLPGRRAVRRLVELLVDATDGRVTPPLAMTVFDLPEKLYAPQRAFADRLTQQLAWADVLQKTPRDELTSIIRELPEENDIEGWRSLGDLLATQHKELAGDGLDFHAVARQGVELPEFNERHRWQLLARLQDAYLARLDEEQLWDRQTARLVAVERKECGTESDILLVGTVDINKTTRAMLDLVAESVTAIVHAPAEMADRFDAYGCLIPAAWEQQPIVIDDDAQIFVADSATDQAGEIVYQLAEFDGRYACDEVIIGVPDVQLVPHIQQQLEAVDLSGRYVVGRMLKETLPYRFLRVAADWLEDASATNLASMVRHPDVDDWLRRQEIDYGWLSLLDRYRRKHLVKRVDNLLGNEEVAARLNALTEKLSELLSPLSEEAQRLERWQSPIVKTLQGLYAHRKLNTEDAQDSYIIGACKAIGNALNEQGRVPKSLSPPVTAAQGIKLLLEMTAGDELPPPHDDAAIEILGWLELALDDAPALIVSSFNEGFVPKSVNADLFLPNRLRSHLDVDDNDRRYARDAYALTTMLHSKEHVRLIVGRRNHQNDPLQPSRLLFASDPLTVARRVRRFCQGPSSPVTRPPLPRLIASDRPHTGILIPRPQPLEEPKTRLSVTSFGTYLTSPFSYYLRHILGLKPLDDVDEEMDPLSFGNLVHDVLAAFGQSDVKDATSPVVIAEYLSQTLSDKARQQFGNRQRGVVQVQLLQLQHRLERFADWQAEWAAAGWEIFQVEAEETETVDELKPADRGELEVEFPLDDGRRVTLHGRIDRIDHNPQLDAWAILDYKTGEGGDSPEKVHRAGSKNNKTWKNLQLPLYRHLAQPLGVSGDVRLGYVKLPRASADVRADFADWDEDALAAADQTAHQVAKMILDEQFDELNEKNLGDRSEFASIVQLEVMDRGMR